MGRPLIEARRKIVLNEVIQPIRSGRNSTSLGTGRPSTERNQRISARDCFLKEWFKKCATLYKRPMRHSQKDNFSDFIFVLRILTRIRFYE